MAITKIHPIRATLNMAIGYITNGEKTDENILVTCHGCNEQTAHLEFELTREEYHTKAKVLANHLIQSFAKGEVDPQTAHEIGQKLCNEILKGQYEYVLTTHIDKKHIHNHIIFNHVSYQTGKCYRNNKGSYHNIRWQSDKLCREYKLSVIDEQYRRYMGLRKKKSMTWKEWSTVAGTESNVPWKNSLAISIDRLVVVAHTFDEFIDQMKREGYEVKQGKLLAFRAAGQSRFTRTRKIGEYYTEENIRRRIEDKEYGRQVTIALGQIQAVQMDGRRKEDVIGNIIDVTQDKVKNSIGYKKWATKHNLQTMASNLMIMNKMGYQTFDELDSAYRTLREVVKDLSDECADLSGQKKKLEGQIRDRYVMQQNEYHVDWMKDNPEDKLFAKEYYRELYAYRTARERLAKVYGEKIPPLRQLIDQYESIDKRRDGKLKEYYDKKSEEKNLGKLHRSYLQYTRNHHRPDPSI